QGDSLSVEREEGAQEYLDECHRYQGERVDPEDRGRDAGRASTESSVLEEQPDDAPPEHCQQERGWHTYEERQRDRTSQCQNELVPLRCDNMFRQAWKGDHPYGDRDHRAENANSAPCEAKGCQAAWPTRRAHSSLHQITGIGNRND